VTPSPRSPTRHRAHTQLAVVSAAIIEESARPVRVLHFPEGYVVLDAAAAAADPGETEREELAVTCIACLIDLCPEVGQGLDVAQRSGSARLWEGAWLEEMA
jgi:hypothetical protein